MQTVQQKNRCPSVMEPIPEFEMTISRDRSHDRRSSLPPKRRASAPAPDHLLWTIEDQPHGSPPARPQTFQPILRRSSTPNPTPRGIKTRHSTRLRERRKSSIASVVALRILHPWLRCPSGKQLISVAHWLLSLAILFLLITALSFDSWRKISVNRSVLLFLWKEGKVPGEILDQTISYSRVQGIYIECVINSDSE